MKKGNQIYYIAEKPLAENHAGNKARLDIDRMLERKGFSPLEYFEFLTFPSFTKKLMYKASPRYLKKLGKLCSTKGEKIILQYPFFGDVFTQKVFKRLVRNNQVILVVHDVDALRNFGGAKLSHELELFQYANCLIVHNIHMKQALQQLKITVPMVELDLFDYLLSEGKLPVSARHAGREVVFAGNLYKSRFLQIAEIGKLDIQLNLYGLNFQKERIGWENVSYRGCYNPEEIPYKLQGSFGLIWDGDSIDTCSGSFGKYMQYNNPHKLSLYVAAGLPVVTWKKAAIADFVDANNIGFCVDSLQEIPVKLDRITDEEYNMYLNSVISLQKKVSNGMYFNEAVDKSLMIIK